MAVPAPAQSDIVIVGAGAIGLCTAWRLALRGRAVTLVDPSPGRGAVWAAAGMLAPASEAHFGDEALVPLLALAADRWKAFAAELEANAGELGFRATGTVVVGADASDRAELSRIVSLQRSLGLEVLDLERAELQRLEPALAPSLRVGVLIPGDHQVDTRRLVRALLAEIDRLGVQMVEARVLGIERGLRPRVDLDDGRSLEAAQIVLCPGAHLGQISGLDDLDLPRIRPVKGHVLRLGGDPLLERTVRGTVRGRSIYLVPRADGELVVGASVEERGFDTRIQAGEVHRLLDDARRIVPGIDELELVDVSTGLRPGSPDNAPTIAAFDDGRLVVATGHHRNGVLLAPLSAEVSVGLLEGAVPAELAAFHASHPNP
jgi:glycine oxidase